MVSAVAYEVENQQMASEGEVLSMLVLELEV